MIRQLMSMLVLLLICNISFAQGNFIGIAKYKLGVLGGTDTNTDSMTVVFDQQRIAVILYIPDGNKISQKIFIDDLKANKSYRLDADKLTYEADSLKTATAYKFINSNSIGYAVNNELCFRYKADLSGTDKTNITSAECLGSINYSNSFINNYSFLGVQPIIVDNRVVMDFTVVNSNGTKPTITVSDIRRMDNVDKYFDLAGYTESK
ncbi:MAG: hypothetical protein QM737_22280 [Ferruginibacter sp.]